MAYKIKQNKRFSNLFIIIAVLLLSCLPSYLLLLKGLYELFKIYQAFNFQSLFIVMALFSLILILSLGCFKLFLISIFQKILKF